MKKLTRRQLLLAVGTLLVVIVLIFAMTSAWINNVSQTKPLTFKTEVWGITQDKIVISDTVASAAPGTGGTVSFSVDNTANSGIIKLSVSIAKTMNEELKKRVFFYAEKSYTENGETVDRKYIGAGADNAYEYTLPAGQMLQIGEDYCSDTPVRWEWVYDMTGYYFTGSVASDGVVVEEYLRPIEYDYDKATYDLSGSTPSGRLVTVDGVPVAEFLSVISGHDGYSGTISEADDRVEVDSKIYYPVSVPGLSSGDTRGVWAYLCTWNEIEAGIYKDTTELSGSSFTASMTVTASNVPTEITSVYNGNGLLAALPSYDHGATKLSRVIGVKPNINRM